jgi:hypothetical protein
VIVHQNPDGANPLPKEVFRGPCDERYGVREDGQIGRTFVGEEIRTLETDRFRSEFVAGSAHNPPPQ